MNFVSKPENIVALAMIVFFFFPWANLGGFMSVAGYQIPDKVKGLGQFASFVDGKQKTDPRIFIYYALYLIPILGALVITINLSGGSGKPLAFILGALPIVFLVFLISEAGSDVFQFLAIGAWLTIAAGVSMFFVLGANPKASRVNPKYLLDPDEVAKNLDASSNAPNRNELKRKRGY